jgi:membrane-associated phospholipid phosphatase
VHSTNSCACLALSLIWSANALAQTDAGSAAAPAPAAALTQPSRLDILGDGIKRVPGELGTLFRYPFDAPADFGKYALGVGLLIALDKPITRAYQDHFEKAVGDFKVADAPGPFKKAGEKFGTGGTDGWMLFGVASTYLGGFAFGDAKAQQVGVAATKSLAYSIVVSQVLLKSLTGRKRPLTSLSTGTPDDTFTDNPYDWGNRRPLQIGSDPKNSSFPSFHFTAFFAVAKVYQQAYDNYWVPYSLMAVGLASDIKGHRHWVSDMVAGALIGTGIGWAVSKDNFADGKTWTAGVSFTDGRKLLLARKF